MNRLMTTVMTTMLLTTGVMLAAPAALAHECDAQYPATSCGECKDLFRHDHDYNDGSNYCSSSGAGIYACTTDASRLVKTTTPGSIDDDTVIVSLPILDRLKDTCVNVRQPFLPVPGLPGVVDAGVLP